ncbi:TIGR02677 family protein [Streptomyces sp. RGM 3693]|uniref:TIGR02677 family protein n=1 Tax=Streptomyces sp. RGM 3693 TaxID=3413284 RepID=UPI003D26686D
MGGSTSDAAQDTDEEARRRLNVYTYLSAPERLEHIAIMRVFCGTLLADLAVPDIMAKLRQADGSAAGLDADTLTVRLEQLVQWGNLLRSSHTVKASSISEYQRSRSRYQLSKLGERIQRDADGVLAEADAAREVSNELLALVERGLRELAGLVTVPGGIESQDGLERISTLFVQFTEFADSIRDFYAYLGQVLSRYDLDSAEYQGFKELLLDYVEAITEDVAFRAPRISAALDTLWPHIPALLDRLDAHAQGLTGLSAQGEDRLEVRVQRSRGRELADWEGLRGWFSDADGQGSQVDQLRDATLRALQSLLANAKRMLRSATGEMSRRKDLLRLARWFDEAAPQDAHDIAVAAFGLYGARHLGIPPATDEVVPAYTSWWTGPVVEVPVALRERGSRAQRGRTSAVEDHSAQKQRLREAARQRAAARAAAADELRSASGRFAEVHLTSAALGLLLELLATALGNAQLRSRADTGGEAASFALDSARSEDAELGIRLTVRRAEGTQTVLHSADGDLLLDHLELDIGRISVAGGGEAKASVS